MKFVLVTYRRPRRVRKNPERGFQYPELYDSEEVARESRGQLLYDFDKGFDANGNAEMLMRVTDRLADKYDEDPNMRIISNQAARNWFDNNTSVANAPDYQVHEKIVAAVHVRLAAGMTPTPEELEMLDPDHPRAGIRRVVKTLQGYFR